MVVVAAVIFDREQGISVKFDMTFLTWLLYVSTVLLQEVSTIDFANYWNLMLQFFSGLAGN